MSAYKTGNPALSTKAFTGFERLEGQETMTLQGTINKIAILLVLVFIPAIFVWDRFTLTQDFYFIAPLFYVALIGGFGLALIIIIAKGFSPFLAPVYAVLEGIVLGGLSALMEHSYPGIVFEALILTFGIAAVLLLLYTTRIIKPSENFKLFIASATGGIALYYLLSFGLSFAGVNVPLIHENTPKGILFSVFVVVIAALNLVMDFDFIEDGVNKGAPKYMEWYGAFGVMVTLIWLYLEMLRLLAKSRRK